MPDPRDTPAGRAWKPGSVLIVAAAIGLAGLGVWAVWREAQGNAQRAGSEQDFDVALICAQCGHTLQTTFAQMHKLPPPASAPVADEGSPSPITACPHCRVGSMFRAAACPQCGQPVLAGPVQVGGRRVEPHCFSCDWKQSE